MATSSSSSIDSAIAEALSSLKLGHLILKSEQVKAIKLLCQGQMSLCGSRLAMASPYAIKCSHLCLIGC